MTKFTPGGPLLKRGRRRVRKLMTCECGLHDCPLQAVQRIPRLFTFHGSDGAEPYIGPLIQDSHGNLYGTTSAGGNGKCTYSDGGTGCGVVFKLTATGKESVLYKLQETIGRRRSLCRSRRRRQRETLRDNRIWRRPFLHTWERRGLRRDF